jgi:hypothetical protein
MRIRFEEIRKIPKSDPMPEAANAFIRNSMPEQMLNNGVGKLLSKIEDRRWFGKMKFPKNRPLYEFTFRYGVCQCFTTLFEEGDAAFYMNTNNENVDFGRGKM